MPRSTVRRNRSTRFHVCSRHVDTGPLGTGKCHDLPTELAGVAGVTGSVTPAAGGSVLRGETEVDGFRYGRFQTAIAGQRLGFGECKRRHRMAIHLGVERGLAEEAAVGGLRAKQKIEAATDVVLIFTVHVRMAGAEEREQSERRNSGVGAPPCSAAILTERQLFLAAAELDGVPAAVARLRGGKPAQGRGDGGFRLRVAALPCDEAKPARCTTQCVRAGGS